MPRTAPVYTDSLSFTFLIASPRLEPGLVGHETNDEKCTKTHEMSETDPSSLEIFNLTQLRQLVVLATHRRNALFHFSADA